MILIGEINKTILNISIIILSLSLLIVFLYWRLWFRRRPKRKIPSGEGIIVSPANGRVAVIKRFDTKQKGKIVNGIRTKKWNGGSVDILAHDVAEKGWFILIVMTPLNVHYQRSPLKGEVISTLHTKGKFHNAVKEPEKLLTLENEKNEILLRTKYGNVKVVQIAGVLARRIHCFVGDNQKVEKGSEMGFIDLGSQVALLLPERAKINVKVNDEVIDGESIIGKFI